MTRNNHNYHKSVLCDSSVRIPASASANVNMPAGNSAITTCKLSVKDVCRLCLGAANLVWIFDERIKSPSNMKDVIFITTGVEIAEKDIVSQKICSKCCQITLKMFKFRATATKNDKELKAKYIELQSAKPETNSLPLEVVIKKEKLEEIPCESKMERHENHTNTVRGLVPIVHHSVSELLKIYPKMKLPTTCLGFDFSVKVVLDPRSAEDYLQKHEKILNLLACEETVNGINKSFAETPSSNVSNDSSKVEENIGPQKFQLQVISEVDNPEVGPLRKIVTPEPPRKILKLSESNPLYESVELAPTRPNNLVQCDNEPLTSTEKLHKLYVCKICSSELSSRKDLKMHQRKHLKCQFCKLHLKSISEKDTHFKECQARAKMCTMPNIILPRVENDVEVQNKYPEIVTIIRKPENCKTKGHKLRSSTPVSIVKENLTPLLKVTEDKERVTDIIDISDDDIEISRPHISDSETCITLRNLLRSGEPVPSIKDGIAASLGNLPLKAHDEHSNCTNAIINSQLKTTSDNFCCANECRNDSTRTEMTILEILKHDFKMTGNSLNNCGGNDIQIMKEIIKYEKQKLADGIRKKVQTKFINNNQIHKNTQDNICDFKNLKVLLENYKIPVEIQHSTEFKVHYGTSHVPSKRTFRNHYWYCLKPIEFKPRSKSVSDLNAINDATSPSLETNIWSVTNRFRHPTFTDERSSPLMKSVEQPVPTNSVIVGPTGLTGSTRRVESVCNPPPPSLSQTVGSTVLTASTKRVESLYNPPTPYLYQSVQNSVPLQRTSNVSATSTTNGLLSVYRSPSPYHINPGQRPPRLGNVTSPQGYTSNNSMLSNTVPYNVNPGQISSPVRHPTSPQEFITINNTMATATISNGPLTAPSTKSVPINRNRNINNYTTSILIGRTVQHAFNISNPSSNPRWNSLNNVYSNIGGSMPNNPNYPHTPANTQGTYWNNNCSQNHLQASLQSNQQIVMNSVPNNPQLWTPPPATCTGVNVTSAPRHCIVGESNFVKMN